MWLSRAAHRSVSQADSLEVSVPCANRRNLGVASRLVVRPFTFLVRAVHADRLLVEHRHRATARKRAPASVASRLREESVVYHFVFPFFRFFYSPRATSLSPEERRYDAVIRQG